VSSLTGLVFSYLFIYHFEFGALGFGAKMILTQVIGVNIQLYFNVKLLKLKMSSFVYHQVYTIVLFSIIAYFSTSFISLENNLYEFLVYGIIYTLLTAILIYIFPQIIAITKTELKQFIFRRKI